MGNWIQNNIRLLGPEQEILRFRRAVVGDGSSKENRSLCLDNLARLALPDYEPSEKTRLVYWLVDDDPFDEQLNMYNVYSMRVSIGKLLCMASKEFPELAFDYWFCDTSSDCGNSWIYYRMNIRNGDVSNPRSEFCVATDDGEQVVRSKTTFTDVAELFDDSGDPYAPPFRVQCTPQELRKAPQKLVAVSESSGQGVEVYGIDF